MSFSRAFDKCMEPKELLFLLILFTFKEGRIKIRKIVQQPRAKLWRWRNKYVILDVLDRIMRSANYIPAI